MNTHPTLPPPSSLAPPPRPRLPLRLVAGLVLAILFDTVLQLVWKHAAVSLPEGDSVGAFVHGVLRNPLFLLVLGLMIFQFLNWMMVLADADLSYAQPVTSLSYALVFGLSAVWFKEAVDPWQLVGVICVLVGVWFISQTDHATVVQTASKEVAS